MSEYDLYLFINYFFILVVFHKLKYKLNLTTKKALKFV